MHTALSHDVAYISFVASRKKANAIFSDLRGMNISMDKLKLIKTPAGIDIGAKLPEEVAISILAQIIKNLEVTRLWKPRLQKCQKLNYPMMIFT